VKEVGQQVTAGETIAIMESMKMEIPVESPVAGTISEFLAQEGQIVQDGQAIALVEPG
jgi:biotin carboxyl carrier protein